MDKKTKIPVKEVSSLPEYLQYIEEQCTGERNVLFRGHTSATWKLEPKIARLKLRTNLTLPTSEAEMLRDFKRQALPYVAREFRSDWDWLALAQHHGLPTRLLDWTTNALVALWFAVERPPEENAKGAVWMYLGKSEDYVDDETLKEPFEATRTLIFRPRHLTARIIAQSGWFTIHRYMPDRPGFIPLESNSRQKVRLKKIEIPSRFFPALREDLGRCGLNGGTLFGDLNGISKQLTWEFSPLEDEIDYDKDTRGL